MGRTLRCVLFARHGLKINAGYLIFVHIKYDGRNIFLGSVLGVSYPRA